MSNALEMKVGADTSQGQTEFKKLGDAAEREMQRAARATAFAQVVIKEMAAAQRVATATAQETAVATKFLGASMDDLAKVTSLAKTAFLTLGGVASVGAFKSIITGGIEAKARLFDIARQTGITVEALGALGKVGKLTNTGIDDIASASNKLSKALFTQNEDSKGAAQALKALGINFDDFKKIDPGQQFLTVSKAMAGFADGSEKSAAAMLLFGKTGAQLLPFLDDLSSQTSLASKQTAEAAKMAKEYEVNITKLKGAANAWRNDVVDGVLPTMVKFSEEFLTARKTVDSFNITGAALKTVFETVGVLGANVSFVFGGLGREIGAWAAQVNALAHGDLKGFNAISEAVKDDGVRARAELDKLEQRLLGLAPAPVPDYSNEGRNSKKPRLALLASPGQASTAADDSLTKAIEAQSRAFGEENARLRDQIEQWQQYGAVIDKSRVAVLAFEMTQGKLRGASEKDKFGLIVAANQADEQARALKFFEEQKKGADQAAKMEEERDKSFNTWFEKFNQKEIAGSAPDAMNTAIGKYLRGIGDETKRAEELVNGSFGRMEDAVINFAKTGKVSFGDLFGYMAEEFIRNQLRMAEKKYLLDASGNFSLAGVTTGLGSLFSTVGGFFGFGHKDGLSYVPYDGYPAVLHEGERVLTKGEAATRDVRPTGGGGTVNHFDFSGQTIHVGQGVSRGEVAQALADQAKRTEVRMNRLQQQGKFA